MKQFTYEKSLRYKNLGMIYANCNGPGGLQLAELIAGKMELTAGSRLLDVGAHRGFHSCFLAREYNVQAVAIDPWDDTADDLPYAEHIRINADKWQVADKVLALQAGVPVTGFASESFDFVFAVTTLSLIRIMHSDDTYQLALDEIARLLPKGGVFALGDPMHLDTGLPDDLEPYVNQKDFPWKKAFRSIHETMHDVARAGFEIMEADYVPDAQRWWQEYAQYDPYCKAHPEEDPKAIEVDNGRWASYGIIIARKD